MTIEELTHRLSAALRQRPEVRMAFLFGSSVTKGVDAARDVDIAVSFSRSVSLLELCELAAHLEGITSREVDLVDLDGASTLLRWEIVRAGLPLWAKDERDVSDFRARVPFEYFDLQPFLEREAAGLRRVLEQARWSSSKS